MTDMTIAAIHTSILRVPWPQTPCLKGHAFGDARNLLVLDVETKGGIVGMGYLFSFRPGLHTIAVGQPPDQTICASRAARLHRPVLILPRVRANPCCAILQVAPQDRLRCRAGSHDT